METTISSKYQVVIPKAIRRKHGFLPGQKMTITENSAGLIELRPKPFYNIEDYLGKMDDAFPGNSLEAIRKMRDEDR